MATLPLSDGLYRLTMRSSTNPSAHANIASAKMTIQEAHLKFGHIAHDAIKYTIAKGLILGIELDLTSKPKFCEACAKAKASHQPFPKFRTPELSDMVKESSGTYGDQQLSIVKVEMSTRQPEWMTIPMK